jgi:hypothetical protein
MKLMKISDLIEWKAFNSTKRFQLTQSSEEMLLAINFFDAV